MALDVTKPLMLDDGRSVEYVSHGIEQVIVRVAGPVSRNHSASENDFDAPWCYSIETGVFCGANEHDYLVLVNVPARPDPLNCTRKKLSIG